MPLEIKQLFHCGEKWRNAALPFTVPQLSLKESRHLRRLAVFYFLTRSGLYGCFRFVITDPTVSLHFPSFLFVPVYYIKKKF